MEHVERQEERESEIKASADELDQQGDQLEQSGEELDQQISDTRDEWEQKQRSEDVPGAQEGDMTESHGGSDADPRPGTSENAGGADDEGQSTGNPPNDDAAAGDDD